MNGKNRPWTHRFTYSPIHRLLDNSCFSIEQLVTGPYGNAPEACHRLSGEFINTKQRVAFVQSLNVEPGGNCPVAIKSGLSHGEGRLAGLTGGLHVAGPRRLDGKPVDGANHKIYEVRRV